MGGLALDLPLLLTTNVGPFPSAIDSRLFRVGSEDPLDFCLLVGTLILLSSFRCPLLLTFTNEMAGLVSFSATGFFLGSPAILKRLLKPPLLFPLPLGGTLGLLPLLPDLRTDGLAVG